jgi:hypothetical protein
MKQPKRDATAAADTTHTVPVPADPQKNRRGWLRRERMRNAEYQAKCVALWIAVGTPPTPAEMGGFGQWSTYSNEHKAWLRRFYELRNTVEWGELKAPPRELFLSLIRRVQRERK